MSSPSFNLLTSAVRANFDAQPHVVVVEPDWDSFATLARRHRVEALAWRGLNLLGYTSPDALKRSAQAAIARQLESIAEHRRIRDALIARGVDHRFVKGAALAVLAWPEPQLKTSGDIDLLVEPADVTAAAQALEDIGYHVEQPASLADLSGWHSVRKESAWRHPERRILVDLHIRLVDNPRLDSRLAIGTDRMEVEIAPGLSVATLTPDDTYPYLCIHGASSAWFRLKWVADLAALLHRQPDAAIRRWHEQAVQRSVGTASLQALQLCTIYFGTVLPDNLGPPRRRDRALQWVACRQLEDEAEPTQRLVGTAPIRLSQALHFDSLGDGFGEITRQLREIVSRP